MQLQWKELTGWEELAGGYAVYADCMFMPTEEKYQRKMQAYLQDPAVKLYGCFCENALCGLLVLNLFPQGQAELVGIAVARECRRQGIGRWMLRQVTETCALRGLLAETDDDAVAFYRKNGFAVENRTEYYENQPVTRYQCQWSK